MQNDDTSQPNTACMMVCICMYVFEVLQEIFFDQIISLDNKNALAVCTDRPSHSPDFNPRGKRFSSGFTLRAECIRIIPGRLSTLKWPSKHKYGRIMPMYSMYSLNFVTW